MPTTLPQKVESVSPTRFLVLMLVAATVAIVFSVAMTTLSPAVEFTSDDCAGFPP
jgi:hypothetical protein